jgi:hypothetical protein
MLIMDQKVEERTDEVKSSKAIIVTSHVKFVRNNCPREKTLATKTVQGSELLATLYRRLARSCEPSS